MQNKSLGWLAFDAYSQARAGKTYDDKPIPRWEELDQEIRDAWEVAAAVVHPEVEPWEQLVRSYKTLKLAKPNDRSELDRHYAIIIKDMETVLDGYHARIISEIYKIDA